MTEPVGTLSYMAPEVVSQLKPYNQKSDMWSIGIVGFSLLTGKFPFPVSDSRLLKEKILVGDFKIQKLNQCSKGAVAFIQSLL